jgi:endo-1,4-beta-D-glucanase Y
MSIALAQAKTADSGSSFLNSFTLTPAAVGPGDFLLLSIADSADHAAVTGITDSMGNAWSKWFSSLTKSGDHGLEVWYTVANSGGTPTITVTADRYVAATMILRIYSGVEGSDMLDTFAVAIDNGYIQNHGVSTSSPIVPGDAVIGGYMSTAVGDSYTPGPGYQNLVSDGVANNVTQATQDNVNATGGIASSSNTTSQFAEGIAWIAAIKPAASAAPSAPTNLLANPGDTTVSLTWSATMGASTYKVERATTSGGPYTQIGTTNVPSYTDTGLTNGTTYDYVIVASNRFGDSPLSLPASATPLTIIPTTWYAYGTQPAGKTLPAIQSLFKTKYAAGKAYLITQSGMTANMPAGAYRVQIPDATSANPFPVGTTFSEGMGYWALLTAICSRLGSPIYDPQAAAIFDGLFLYYNHYKDRNGLMNWNIGPDGNISTINNNGHGGATDGDEDFALALVLRHRIAGDGGAINYGAEATKLINAIDQWEFLPADHPQYPNLMANGDLWGFGQDDYMPDYAAPVHWKEFGVHTGNTTRWNNIIAANQPRATTYFYDHFPTGYVPDECKRSGEKISDDKYKYGFNAIRMPWRNAVHMLWNNDPISGKMITKLANFERTFANQVPDNARADCALDGSPSSCANFINAAYLSGFCVAGVGDPATAQWAADCIDWLSNHDEPNYFGKSLELLALLILTGEFKPNF